MGSEVAVARPVRAAASLAVDRATINQALTLGFSRVTGSIIPDNFEFFWRPPAPGRAKKASVKLSSGWPAKTEWF